MAALPFIAIAAMAAGSIMQGMQSSQNAGAQQQAAQANAQYDLEAGKTAAEAAASRGETQQRQGAEQVGEEAAAVGQSGTGIVNAAPSIRQSETNSRMDFLNTIYGGQVQKYGYDVEAQQQEYAAKVAGLNKQNALYGGFFGAGTSALTGAANYGAGTGMFAPTTPTL